MDMNNPTGDARKLHDTLEFIGLRAQATSVGMLQLCTELVRAGILDDAAVERIKGAIHREIVVSHPRARDRADFEQTLRQRLDAIFPRGRNAERLSPVGTLEDMQSALDSGPA